MYVNTNGNITFDSEDTVYDFSPSYLVSQARIAILATDLYVYNGIGSIYGNSIALGGGRQAYAITYSNIGQFDQEQFGGINTMQIVLFDTGAVQLNYIAVNNVAASTTSDFFVGDLPRIPSRVWTIRLRPFLEIRSRTAARSCSRTSIRVSH